LRHFAIGSNLLHMVSTRAIACLLLLLAAPVPACAEEPATAFTLANGLQVVVLPDHRLPIVTHVVYYRAGSADDPPGVSGIAHFTEHLMFKGTRRYPTGAYDRIVTKAGGANNAFTSNDKTYFYEQILKDGLPAIMDLDADRMADMNFPALEAEHEFKVVLAEQRSYLSDPESVLDDMAGQALYGKGVYAHPVLGEPGETGALTLQAALDFHARLYSPSNAIVIVAGDVAPEAVRTLAEATYGKLPAVAPAPPRAWAKVAPDCAEGRVEERNELVPRNKLTYYYLTPGTTGLGVRTEAALRLLSYVLQDQDLSPVWHFLSAQSGLVTGLDVGFEPKLAASELSLTIEAAEGVDLKRLESELHNAVADLRRAGIDAETLLKAKRRWQADRTLGEDDQLGLATRYGEQLANGRSLAEVEAQPRTIADVTLVDINAVLHDFMSTRCYVSASLLRNDAAAAGGFSHAGQ
jgi:zinc protease